MLIFNHCALYIIDPLLHFTFTMFVTAVILFGTLAFAQKPTTHRWLQVGAGNSAILDVDLPDGPVPHITWKKNSRWNATKFQVVANNSYGIIKHHLNIKKCEGLELLIENIDRYWGYGEWTAHYYNPLTNKKEITKWHVEVIYMLPTLIPTMYYKYWDVSPGLVLECQDLASYEKNNAYIVIVDKNVDMYLKVLQNYNHLARKVVFYANPEAACPGYALVRCCAKYKQYVNCSTWTEIYLGNYLSSTDAKAAVCPIKYITYNFAYPKTVNYCNQTQTLVSGIGTNYFCPMQTAAIRSWGKSNVTKWLVQSFPSGRKFRLQGPRYILNKTLIIKNITHWDTNAYAWKNSRFYKAMFFIEVQEMLHVSIAVKQFAINKIVLTCAHSLYRTREMVNVNWHLSHKMTRFLIKNDELELYPDCWHALHYWSLEFKVKCTVSTKLWTGTSEWFSGSLTRQSSRYTIQNCKGFILKRPYFKRAGGLGAVFGMQHEVIV